MKVWAKLNDNDLIVRYKSSWIECESWMTGNDDKSETLTNHIILYIQMELCLNTLKQIIEKVNKELNQKLSQVMTPLGYCIASELFTEILESVDYLHKQKVIHRDLKPNNILITDGMNGRFVKIADFGLATIHEFDGQSHTKYKGTVRYAASEVMSSRKYDTKADIVWVLFYRNYSILISMSI